MFGFGSGDAVVRQYDYLKPATNMCNIKKHGVGRSTVVCCACWLILLFSLLFCPFKVMYKFSLETSYKLKI